ncbi:hypothetical protein EON67_03460 [archaeon]|nr:MAG: hypothetical protein EON67_03460 [archaeon]
MVADYVTAMVSVRDAERLLGTQYHKYEAEADASFTLNRCEAYQLPEEVAAHVDFVAPTTNFPTIRKTRVRAADVRTGTTVTPSVIRQYVPHCGERGHSACPARAADFVRTAHARADARGIALRTQEKRCNEFTRACCALVLGACACAGCTAWATWLAVSRPTHSRLLAFWGSTPAWMTSPLSSSATIRPASAACCVWWVPATPRSPVLKPTSTYSTSCPWVAACPQPSGTRMARARTTTSHSWSGCSMFPPCPTRSCPTSSPCRTVTTRILWITGPCLCGPRARTSPHSALALPAPPPLVYTYNFVCLVFVQFCLACEPRIHCTGCTWRVPHVLLRRWVRTPPLSFPQTSRVCGPYP